MPALLLTLLKVVFVALIYLFVWQVARALASHTGVADRLPRRHGGRGLVVVRSDSQSGLEIDVRDALVMGRSDDADIVLDDPYASEFHFRVLNQEERMVLHDLGSTNGTYVNGRRVVTPVELNRGDNVQVGKTVMEVR